MPYASKVSVTTTVSARLVLLSLVLAPTAAGASEYEYVDSPAGFTGGSCAALGKGFVPVQGTRACVKIGGHVRVEANPTDMPLRTVAGSGQGMDGPMRAHLRLDGPQH